MRIRTLLCFVFAILLIVRVDAGQRPPRPPKHRKVEVNQLRQQARKLKLENARLRALLTTIQAQNRRAADINKQVAEENLRMLREASREEAILKAKVHDSK